MNHSYSARDDLQLSLTEDGTGEPVMVLHGGGGPATVASISAHLAASRHAVTPTHPGWNGTRRPASFSSISDIASVYLQYLEHSGLKNTVLVGSSLGGWIAVEMALRAKAGTIGSIILINAVGIDVPNEPIKNIFGLSPREIAENAFFDPDRFFVDPSTFPPERIALQRGNSETMKVYAGDPYMFDPMLYARLREVKVPTLVIWGEADKIVTPAYGQAYAKALSNAQFAPVPRAGHLPHIEQPQATFALIDKFVGLSA